MTAKEMFEKLGYRERNNIKITGLIKSYFKHSDEIIDFYSNKTFRKVGEYSVGYYNFTMQELQAINKQVEELGWK